MNDCFKAIACRILVSISYIDRRDGARTVISIDRPSKENVLSKRSLDIDSPTYSYLAGVGTAKTLITSSRRGRIRLYGSWWSAVSIGNVIIQPDQRVSIIDRNGMVLIVEPTQEP